MYPVLLMSYMEAVLPGAPSAPQTLDQNPISVYPVLLLSYVDAVLPGALAPRKP